MYHNLQILERWVVIIKKIICFILLYFSITVYGYAAGQDYRDVQQPDYIEIHCLLSGGMKRVIYDKGELTLVHTLHKKSAKDVFAEFGHLGSFVEIQRKTWLASKERRQKLRDWIIKHKIRSIQQVPTPEKADTRAYRYRNELMVYIDSKEYKLNHHTIENNPQLQKAFDELFEMANEFTATEY